MPTAFRDFAALDHATTEGVDYRRELRRTGAGVAHIAVHGGGIEAGAAEAADAVARLNGQDYYAFVGLRDSGNGALHITSIHFDEPQCVALQRSARATVSYHGCAGGRPLVHLGGGDRNLKLSDQPIEPEDFSESHAGKEVRGVRKSAEEAGWSR